MCEMGRSDAAISLKKLMENVPKKAILDHRLSNSKIWLFSKVKWK